MSVLPFAGLILSIAVLPQVAPRLWERRRGSIALLWAVAAVVPLTIAHGGSAVREAAGALLADYLPFMTVIWSLYTLTGGIVVRGGLTGTPASNTLLLGIGGLLASVVGTTGAAMLLVRPLLRANRWRRRRTHQVVFFIFLVCNIGGSLTPLGDPPLLVGFLHGVPFFWYLRLAPVTATVAGILLACFLTLDTLLRRGEGEPPPAERLRLRGGVNVALLLVVVGAVTWSGALELGEVRVAGVPRTVSGLLRDAVLIGAGVASLLLTPESLRRENRFTWEPVREIALLFPGIFVSAVPVLMLLRAGSGGRLAWVADAFDSPAVYFWSSGALSTVLDNTPTFLVFFNAALGDLCCGMSEKAAVRSFVRDHASYLEAVAAGTVFMGAATYLGNGPNLLVRAVAEEEGVPMPGFAGYFLRYGLAFLLPTFLLASRLYFSR